MSGTKCQYCNKHYRCIVKDAMCAACKKEYNNIFDKLKKG